MSNTQHTPRAISAKELRARDPQKAEAWAKFIKDNQTALVKAVSGALRTAS